MMFDTFRFDGKDLLVTSSSRGAWMSR